MIQRTLIILGMHRSGTSALAGSLEELGVYLGHVIKKTDDNPKGWCENPLIFTINETVLRANGGSWIAPPSTCVWQSVHELMRDTIIDSFGSQRLWGFKDPRTLFTLEGWLRRLPDAEFVGIFRNPIAVADSLQRRSRIPVEAAVALWLSYNRKLIEWQRRIGFPLISFDDLGCVFEEQVRGLATFLKLPQAGRVLEYYEKALRHGIGSDAHIPAEAVDVYEELRTIHSGQRGLWLRGSAPELRGQPVLGQKACASNPAR